MATHDDESTRPEPSDAPEVEARRSFLRSLGKWSLAVIGGVVLGGVLSASKQAHAGAWVNRYGGGGGGWVNRYGGGGGGKLDQSVIFTSI